MAIEGHLLQLMGLLATCAIRARPGCAAVPMFGPGAGTAKAAPHTWLSLTHLYSIMTQSTYEQSMPSQASPCTLSRNACLQLHAALPVMSAIKMTGCNQQRLQSAATLQHTSSHMQLFVIGASGAHTCRWTVNPHHRPVCACRPPCAVAASCRRCRSPRSGCACCRCHCRCPPPWQGQGQTQGARGQAQDHCRAEKRSHLQAMS